MRNSQQFIHGPTDIEGHIGKDNRYYVLDFQRTYPFLHQIEFKLPLTPHFPSRVSSRRPT